MDLRPGSTHCLPHCRLTILFNDTFQHNLCCDNCHSHVAMALNKMNYDFNDSWNMVKLCFLMLFYGKHVR